MKYLYNLIIQDYQTGIESDAVQPQAYVEETLHLLDVNYLYHASGCINICLDDSEYVTDRS